MENRRELIKKIGTGAVWATPVIQSIILPAHAQASPTTQTQCSVAISGPSTWAAETLFSIIIGPVFRDDENSQMDTTVYVRSTFIGSSGFSATTRVLAAGEQVSLTRFGGRVGQVAQISATCVLSTPVDIIRETTFNVTFV